MTRNSVALLAFVLASLPASAFAVPATVTEFEAQVHAAPDPSSPVIHTFAENARVSVSEKPANGFRKVRLPDGKVGYIAESAIALDEVQPPGPPPAAPPPPPPPGGPPPPPGGPPPAPYGEPYQGEPYQPYGYQPYRVVLDPTAYRHLGLFLRVDLGLGYMSSSTSASRTLFVFDKSHGLAGDFAFAIGGTLRENLVLAAQFWSTWAASPTLTSRGVAVPNGGALSTSLYGVGPNLTWYLMPANVFLSVTPSLTWMSFGDYYYNSYQTDVGFGTRFALGKEWWVGPHWGMGVSGWFSASFTREGGGSSATWQTYEGGIGFSGTFN